MIIITGATGFVGRRFVKDLLKVYKKDEILCLVRKHDSVLEVTGREILKKLGLKYVYVDLVTGDGLSALPKSPEKVFHLAANTEVLDKDHRVNDVGISNLLKFLGKLDKRTHIIHVSTLVIYSGKFDTQYPINEETPPSPTNEYSRSKMIGEKLMVDACERIGFRLSVIRPNTIYGKGGRENGLFDTMIKQFKNGSILSKLNWPGKSSLVYVGDVSKTLIELSKKLPRPGKPEIYILDPEALSLSEISKIIHSAKGKNYNEIYLPNIFWRFCCLFRPLIYKSEKFLSVKTYNWLWRFSLIIEDVIFCKTNKLSKAFPNLKFKKLSDVIHELV